MTRFHHRSSGDKSVGCVLQTNRCLTSYGEAPHSVQMSLGSPNTLCSVLTVAVSECIVVFGSVSAPRPILGVDAPSVFCPSVLCWFHAAE